MKKLYPVLVICLLLTCFAACKKDTKPSFPVALAGKWYIQKRTLTGYVNGSYESSTTTPVGWFPDSDYYQLYADGTGIQSYSNPFIANTNFYFRVSNSNIILSQHLALLSNDTITYAMPTNTQLIWTDSYTYLSTTGDTYKTVEEVDLSK